MLAGLFFFVLDLDLDLIKSNSIKLYYEMWQTHTKHWGQWTWTWTWTWLFRRGLGLGLGLAHLTWTWTWTWTWGQWTWTCTWTWLLLDLLQVWLIYIFFAFKIERVVKYHRVMPTPSPMRKKKGCNDHGSWVMGHVGHGSTMSWVTWVMGHERWPISISDL